MRTRRRGLDASFRTLIILAVLFLGLLVVVLLQGNESADSLTPTVEAIRGFERVFPELEVLDIDAIQLLDPSTSQEFTIARRNEDGIWTAPAFPNQTLDAEAATLIARTIALLPYRRSFTIEEDTDYTQYGLAPEPDFLIQFITSDGQGHSVALGEPTFESPTFYGLVDDRLEIYLIERAPIDFLLRYFVEPPVSS
ncbi:MAG: hypothetical protein OHK0046_01410 [Anaerolineae bacterium]